MNDPYCVWYNKHMNIFVLDKDPKMAARNLCNKHVSRMPLESAQMLCTAFPIDVTTPYRRTHVNHPCSKWTRASSDNYVWHVEHALEICNEYTRRYDRRHASQDVIEWCHKHMPNLPNTGVSQFAVAIKDQAYHDPDPVIAYRAYYIGEKYRFAKWAPRSDPPSWWPFEENVNAI